MSGVKLIEPQTELKGCPFCSRQTELRIVVDQNYTNNWAKIFCNCQSCGAKGPDVFSPYDSEDDELIKQAIKLWEARRE
jgi:C4-type Zn-finger protein